MTNSLGSEALRILLHDYGGYSFTNQLGRTLAGRGHRVLYSYSLTTQLMQRFAARPAHENLEMAGIQLPRAFNRYSYLRRWRDERLHGRLVGEQVRNFQPEVVLAANTPLDAQVLIQRASREVKAAFLFWMQDLIGLAAQKNLSSRFPLLGPLLGEHYQQLEKKLVIASDEVILISDRFFSDVRGWGIASERMHLLPNWAPLEEIPLLPKENPWAKAQGLTDKFVFLYSGVLGLKHDASLFLALADSFRTYPEVRVVIVAEGPFAEKLQAQACASALENLVLLPYQPPAEYSQVLASADVLMTILNADAGTYSVPSKVNSYLCAGRPQLLSLPSDNDVAKLVSSRKIGLVSEPGDVESWLMNAHALYQNRYNHNQMAMNARAYAEENFDIERITDKFETMMKLALRGG